MKLTATLTDGSATALVPEGIAWNPRGAVIDVSLLASADTSVALVIADATGTFFSVASADFTTRTNYKNDNAALLRNGVQGKITATATGLGSGTLIVDLFIKPD